MGHYCYSQSGHGIGNHPTIEDCAAEAQAKFNAGTCTNPQGLFEYDPGDGDCNCCEEGTDFVASSYYDTYAVEFTAPEVPSASGSAEDFFNQEALVEPPPPAPVS
jgi:hypothetical protein